MTEITLFLLGSVETPGGKRNNIILSGDKRNLLTKEKEGKFKTDLADNEINERGKFKSKNLIFKDRIVMQDFPELVCSHKIL